MKDPYSPERHAHDLARMLNPASWPVVGGQLCLKRWSADRIEFAILVHHDGKYYFYTENNRLIKIGGKEVPAELADQGWVLD
jgi:hypothetical protein